MAVRPMVIWNWERGTLSDHLGSISASASRNTTSPVSGTADLQLTYPSGAGLTWTLTCQLASFLVPATFGTARKSSFAFPFRFSANPANHAAIGLIDGLNFYISTARKIRYDGVDSSDSALTANTVYWLNIIADRDWRGAGAGSIIFRVYDSSFSTLLQTLQSNKSAVISATNFGFGETTIKAATGPATNIHIGSGVWLVDNSGSIKAPWLKNPTLQTFRVPTANGSDNSAIGVSDATNKYNNVDENPTSSADYNHMGEFSVTHKQTFQFGTATYGSAPLGYSTTQVRKLSGGQAVSGDHHFLEVYNSTDYTYQDTPPFTSGAISVGGDKLPDDSSLSTTNLNNLRIGHRTNLTDTNYNSGQLSIGVPISDSTYNDFTASGGGGSKYVEVDDGATADNANYIISTASGHKQGFTFNFNPTPATIGDTIRKVVFRVTGRNNSSSSGSFCRMGVRISGVDYVTSNFLVDASLTVWSEDVVEFLVSSSHLNPATGNRWSVSDITGAVWFIEQVTKGTGDLYISNITLGFYGAGRWVQEAAWLNVITGTAFEENGNVLYVDRSTTINQSVNRANTF